MSLLWAIAVLVAANVATITAMLLVRRRSLLRGRRSRVLGVADAAEADVAHAGVDHLGASRGGAVALAVAVGTQERAALDDLARDLELRLGGVQAAAAV